MNLTFMNYFDDFHKKNHYTILTILILLILFSSADLAMDGFPYLSTPHLTVHISLILLYLGFIILLLRPKKGGKSLANEEPKTAQQPTPSEIAFQETSAPTQDKSIPPEISLSSKMENAFSEWQLTTAEKKVAALLILGYSLKEIAESCHRGEGTVRQHATTVYKKAQLSGRAKLTAYFLQDFIDTEKLLFSTQLSQSNVQPPELHLNMSEKP